MGDNHKDKKAILEIHYDESSKTIDVKFGATFVPMLCYAIKLAEMQLENMILEQSVKKQQDKIVPIDLNGLGKLRTEGFKL